MRPCLGNIWNFRFQRSAGLKLDAEHGKIAQWQNWADFHKRANILAILHSNFTEQISSNFKTAHFSISTRKYHRTSTILIRNLHNAYKYNNLPLKPKSNFLYGGILQITPNPGYYPKRDSTWTLSENQSGVLANASKIDWLNKNTVSGSFQVLKYTVLSF